MQVGSVDDYLATVLHMAVKYGVVDTVRELIEHGADKDRSVMEVTGWGQPRGLQGQARPSRWEHFSQGSDRDRSVTELTGTGQSRN